MKLLVLVCTEAIGDRVQPLTFWLSAIVSLFPFFGVSLHLMLITARFFTSFATRQTNILKVGHSNLGFFFMNGFFFGGLDHSC